MSKCFCLSVILLHCTEVHLTLFMHGMCYLHFRHCAHLEKNVMRPTNQEQHDSNYTCCTVAATLNQIHKVLSKVKRKEHTSLMTQKAHSHAQIPTHSRRINKPALKVRAMSYLHSRHYHLAVGGSHPYTHSSLLPPGSHSRSAPHSRGPLSKSHNLQEAWVQKVETQRREKERWKHIGPMLKLRLKYLKIMCILLKNVLLTSETSKTKYADTGKYIGHELNTQISTTEGWHQQHTYMWNTSCYCCF